MFGVRSWIFATVLLLCIQKSTQFKYGAVRRQIKTESVYNEIVDLSVDLVKKSKPIKNKCYAIITDSTYNRFLNSRLFDVLMDKPLFVLKIPDYADMLSPKPKIENALMEIRKVGCGVYLILIENGLQLERFLRYGDKTRMLDTRARYIMLYDYRLFDKKLIYIWRRIINVLFIRQYDTAKQGSLNVGSWFELSTVPYPNPLKGVFTTKRVDFWRSGRFRYNRALFEDITHNLGGCTMKVVVLEHIPAVTKADTEYSGIEVEIMHALGQTMNFEPEFFETSDADTEKWGRADENSTYTGLLGTMDKSMADFALADLHYTPYHLEIVDLSVPYNRECLTFLTPESVTDNSWKTLILPFSGEMWACVMASLCIVGFVFYSFAHFYLYLQREPQNSRETMKFSNTFSKFKTRLCFWRKKVAAKKQVRFAINPAALKLKALSWNQKDVAHNVVFNTISNCVVYTFSMALLVSLPKLPTGWSLRLLTGWYWIYCILLVVSYRAAMTAILANPVKRVTIDTVDGLSKSGLDCGAWGEENRNLFTSSTDEAAQAIGAKLEHIENAEVAVERVINGKFAYFENIHFLQKLRTHSLESNVGAINLHVMKECVVVMPISIGFEKNSPIKPRADKLIRGLIEGGLINKWMLDSQKGLVSMIEAPPQIALMDLSKFCGALVALGIGCALGLLALLGEKLYWTYFIVKHHPLYDPYEIGKMYRNNNTVVVGRND